MALARQVGCTAFVGSKKSRVLPSHAPRPGGGRPEALKMRLRRSKSFGTHVVVHHKGPSDRVRQGEGGDGPDHRRAFPSPGLIRVGGRSFVGSGKDVEGDPRSGRARPDDQTRELLQPGPSPIPLEGMSLLVKERVRLTQTSQPEGAAACEAHALVVTMYRGGFRLAEALALKPADVRPRLCTIRILRGKDPRPPTFRDQRRSSRGHPALDRHPATLGLGPLTISVLQPRRASANSLNRSIGRLGVSRPAHEGLGLR